MTLARANQTYPIFSYPEVRDVRDDIRCFRLSPRQSKFGADPGVVGKAIRINKHVYSYLASTNRVPFQIPRTAGAILSSMALLISVLAGALFGVMPLRQIFKTDPKRYQERREPIFLRMPLGASRCPTCGADRALLCHRHRCLCLAARLGQRNDHEHGYQSEECRADEI